MSEKIELTQEEKYEMARQKASLKKAIAWLAFILAIPAVFYSMEKSNKSAHEKYKIENKFALPEAKKEVLKRSLSKALWDYTNMVTSATLSDMAENKGPQKPAKGKAYDVVDISKSDTCAYVTARHLHLSEKHVHDEFDKQQFMPDKQVRNQECYVVNIALSIKAGATLSVIDLVICPTAPNNKVFTFLDPNGIGSPVKPLNSEKDFSEFTKRHHLSFPGLN